MWLRLESRLSSIFSLSIESRFRISFPASGFLNKNTVTSFSSSSRATKLKLELVQFCDRARLHPEQPLTPEEVDCVSSKLAEFSLARQRSTNDEALVRSVCRILLLPVPNVFDVASSSGNVQSV